MSRIRLLLLGLLGVFAVGAAASASSADSCTGGTSFVFCNHNNAPLHNAPILGTSTLALLVGTIGGAQARFHCPSDDFKATLELLGAFSGLILFLGCKEEKPAGCKLSAAQEIEIDAKFTAQQRSLTLALFTGSGVGEAFATLEIVNIGGCAIPTGNYAVTGKQLVETPRGGESKAEHEIVARKIGSFLTFDGHEASFSSTTTDAHLVSRLAWLVMEGV